MKKHTKVLDTYNKKLYAFMTLLVCLFFVLLFVIFFHEIFVKGDLSSEVANIEINILKNSNPIDLDNVIKKNTCYDLKEQIVTEESDWEYTTIYKQNSELAQGSVQVLQEGRNGKKNVVIIKKYKSDELISEEQVAENIINAPIERIVEIGTGSKYNNYEVKEGDIVYVFSTSVAVRIKPNVEAEKICTLNKNESAKVLKIEDDWCLISNIEIEGYIPINCVTTKNPQEDIKLLDSKYSKTELLAMLDRNMDLTKQSGFSLEQFKKVMENDFNDKNNVFSTNADYFYYIEKQYNINGIFVAAVGIHESGWGTSTISKNKKNLFGYGAVDSNPYDGAYTFKTYEEGIDLIARVFVKYYINRPGTVIFDGTTASGKFFSGSTINSVGTKYASDKNWSSGVYKWMEYLYNKL